MRFAILVLTLAGAVNAQSTFATIVGAVRDQTGALVPLASVHVIELETGVETRVASAQDGRFEIRSLQPGRYTLAAESAGFAPSKIVEVALESRRIVRVLLSLSVAPLRQELTVEEALVGINTEDGSISHTAGPAQINQLPLNFRAAGPNPNALMFTIPGVRGSDAAPNGISIAGGFPAQVEYSIDGISTVNVRFNQALPIVYPSPEAVREFKVTAVDANAEFGQMGDVSLITRGGTNQMHGSLLWYHQNASLDAKTYNAPIKQAKVYNAFGGSAGGPLRLGRLYDGKDRTFFFFAYEGNRKPGNVLRQNSVPTGEMWKGRLDGVPGSTAMDPLSGLPFPGNTIPLTRINSVASNLSTFYPLPNVNAGTTLNNYRALVVDTSDIDTQNLRFDHGLSSRQKMFGRWTWARNDFALDRAPLLPPSRHRTASNTLVLSHNFLAHANLTNEFRFGLTYAGGGEEFPIRGVDAVEQLGLEGVDLKYVGDVGGFPAFAFQDGIFTSIGHGREIHQYSRNLQFTDDFTWIHGRHTWKFGADIRRLNYEDALQYGPNGDFGWFRFDRGAFSGNSFADLLLGLPAQTQFGTGGPNLNQSAVHSHFYAEDRWQATPRLTLSFGLRWQIHPPMTEASGNMMNFDRVDGAVILPDQTLPASPEFLSATNACPGLTKDYPCTPIVSASQTGLGPGLRRTSYGNLTPRFGIAYRPFQSGRTVVRAGFGVYTHTILGPAAYFVTAYHTADVRMYQNFQGSGMQPLFMFPQTRGGSFPVSPPGNAFGAGTDPSYRDPSSYQWNATVEHEFRSGLSARASYIAVQTVGLSMRQELNQVPAGTTPYSPSLKPYPVWSSILSLDNLGFANFQSLEAELTQRFSRGVSFQAAYTLAKHLGNGGGPAGGLPGPQVFPGEDNPRVPMDRFNLGLDRGNLLGTRRHRFVFNGILALPLGRGRQFGSRLPAWAEILVGGRDLSTVALLQSGIFQTPLISPNLDQSNTNVAGSFFRLARPDRIGYGNLANPARDLFYDIGAFVPTPAGAGRFGNSGVGILRGPHSTAIAAGLFKTFTLTERARLRLEGTFTNLPNHPNFWAPDVNVSNPASFGKLTTVLRTENGGNRTGQVGVRLEF